MKITETTVSNSNQNEVQEEVSERVISLHVVQDMMKVQQDTMLACFNQVVESLSKKVDNIMCDVQGLENPA